jgi:hypothetical protein
VISIVSSLVVQQATNLDACIILFVQVCYEHVSEQGSELYELVSLLSHVLMPCCVMSCGLISDMDLVNQCVTCVSLLLLQVAHLPDKANNYLAPALSVLEKNT